MPDKAVPKPTSPDSGINKPENPPKPSANALLQKFLDENNVILMLDNLDKNIRIVDDGSILIGEPKITARYKNG